MARGAHCEDNTNFLRYNTSLIFDVATEDFTICGWRRILTAIASENTKIHYLSLFVGQANTNNGMYMGSDVILSTVEPIIMKVYGHGQTGATTSASSVSESVNEDWFHAIVYDHTTQQATFYQALDEAASLTANTSVTATNYNACDEIRLLGPDNFSTPGLSHSDITNVKCWKAALTQQELFLEMKCEEPFRTSGIYAHWKIQKKTDLFDYSGQGRYLVQDEAMTDPVMDPVDIKRQPLRIQLEGI
mgnify:CR=1 FL=1